MSLSEWWARLTGQSAPTGPEHFLSDFGPNGFTPESTDTCERLVDYAVAYIGENVKIQEELARLFKRNPFDKIYDLLHGEFTRGMRLLSIFSAFDHNVTNGGAYQFFFNAGQLTDASLDAMQDIGSTRLRARFAALVHETRPHLADIAQAKSIWDAEGPKSVRLAPTATAFDAYEGMRQQIELSCNAFDDEYLASPAISDDSALDSIRGELCRLMVRYIEEHRAEFEVARP